MGVECLVYLNTLDVAQGYMAAMDLGPEARYKDVRTS